MTVTDQSLDDLSAQIRAELSKGSEHQKLTEGARIQVNSELRTMNEAGVDLEPGMYGRVIEIDVDGDMLVDFGGRSNLDRGIEETQWIAKKDSDKLKVDNEVQIAPTQNYLTTMANWSFYPRKTLCCGMMGQHMQNALIKIFRCRCDDPNTADTVEAQAARSLMMLQDFELKLATKGSVGAQSSQTIEASKPKKFSTKQRSNGDVQLVEMNNKLDIIHC